MTDEELERRLKRMSLEIETANSRKRAFGENYALYSAVFANDCGASPKLAEARRYAESWPEMQNTGTGLLFWGAPGSGKTFAAACIANELCGRNYEVRMTTLGTFLTRLPAMTAAEKEAYLRDLVGCSLLIIDDFGMERHTEYAQEQVFALIDGRYLSGRPMLVTTNLSLDELKSPGTLAHTRICDRVLEMCVPVFFGGESLRRTVRAKRLEEYVRLTRGQDGKAPSA